VIEVVEALGCGFSILYWWSLLWETFWR